MLTSVLQQVGVVDRGRPAGAEDAHDDREPDDHLGGRHDHDEERHDLAVQRAVHAAERDEGQVDRVQHQLDRHEHEDRVAAQQDAERTDREDQGGQVEVVAGVHRWCTEPPESPTCSASRAGSTLPGASVPSGSSDGVAAESRSAKTPGPGSGVGCPPEKRARAISRWVIALADFSLCASTIAPSAAVMSSALVISKAKTYFVNSSRAMPTTLPSALTSSRPAPPPSPTPLAIAVMSSPAKPRPRTNAASRWPRSVSTSESLESTPTSIRTNRNSIRTAPV